jgi:DNA-binding NarL/FixJ family response regulator
VLALMLKRKNHVQIARTLGLTTHTIQNHIVEIWDRLCEPRNTWYALDLLHTLYEEHSAKSVSRPASPHLEVSNE